MSRITTLTDIKISLHDYNKEISLYQNQIQTLNQHIIQLSTDSFKNKDMILMLKAQLKEIYKKQPQMTIVKPTPDDESIFKKMNDQLMRGLQLTEEQQAKIRNLNMKEIEEFKKECML